MGEGMGRYRPPTNSFLFLGVYTSVSNLVKIDEEMRPWECPQTDRHSHTHARTDAKRFYYLSHAICYSYGADNKTYEASIACYRLLPHTHRLPSLSWCRSLCQKWEWFFVKPEMKTQWTVLVGYLTISTNVSCYQTRCCGQYYLSFINTAHACTSAWCAQHSSTAAVQNF